MIYSMNLRGNVAVVTSDLEKFSFPNFEHRDSYFVPNNIV